MASAVQVGVAVLRDAAGRVLIAERPAGRPHAGEWEFPGGKLEPGEPVAAGLARELAEELGIEVLADAPLLTLIHDYPERRVALLVRTVHAWRGTPVGREGQRLAWVAPAELPSWPILPADRPIVDRLRLPARLHVTPDLGADTDAFLAMLDRALAGGARLVQLRAGALEPRRQAALAGAVVARCRAAGAIVLLNSEPRLAAELGADGVHLTSARLRALERRPLPRDAWVSASVHDADQLARAAALDVDLVLLGPVHTTRSHPQAVPLGWKGFAALACATRLPVYALGGVAPGDLARARAAGAHGVAGISSFWDGA